MSNRKLSKRERRSKALKTYVKKRPTKVKIGGDAAKKRRSLVHWWRVLTKYKGISAGEDAKVVKGNENNIPTIAEASIDHATPSLRREARRVSRRMPVRELDDLRHARQNVRWRGKNRDHKGHVVSVVANYDPPEQEYGAAFPWLRKVEVYPRSYWSPRVSARMARQGRSIESHGHGRNAVRDTAFPVIAHEMVHLGDPGAKYWGGGYHLGGTEYYSSPEETHARAAIAGTLGVRSLNRAVGKRQARDIVRRGGVSGAEPKFRDPRQWSNARETVLDDFENYRNLKPNRDEIESKLKGLAGRKRRKRRKQVSRRLRSQANRAKKKFFKEVYKGLDRTGA